MSHTKIFSKNTGPHGEKCGDRVQLIECTDEYTFLAPGSQGTVSHIDDAQTVFVDWDSGSKLGLVHSYDKWFVLPLDQKDQVTDGTIKDLVSNSSHD